MRFNTIIKLGPNREMTKEGFTLFRNVSVSRTGEQVYGPDEGTGIEPGPDGYVYISRTPEEVFRRETLESGNGKSLVLLHPDDDVIPDNWRELTNGFMVNMRRGTGDQSNECVADVLVTTPEGIRAIDHEMREVSLGYDADYFQTGPGRGEQRNIFINHVALVPAGRCGSRCAVRDHAHHTGECEMKSRWQRVLDAINSKDEEKIKKEVEDARDEDEKEESEKEEAERKTKDAAEEAFKKETRDSIASLTKLVTDCLSKIKDKDEEESEGEEKRRKAEDEQSEEELEEETGTADARKAKDSALLADPFESVKMHAEIVAPGIEIPTFDAAADPKKTFRDCVCGLRRKALAKATTDTTTAALITTVRGRATDAGDIFKMSPGQVRTLFNGVATMKKAQNNTAITRDGALAVPNAGKTEDNLSPTQKFIKSAKAMKSGTK